MWEAQKKRAALLFKQGSSYSRYGGEIEIRTLERRKPLHDFQSCSFDQLGQLSIDQMTRNIIYDFIQKSKQIFRIIQNLLYRRIPI